MKFIKKTKKYLLRAHLYLSATKTDFSRTIHNQWFTPLRQFVCDKENYFHIEA